MKLTASNLLLLCATVSSTAAASRSTREETFAEHRLHSLELEVQQLRAELIKAKTETGFSVENDTSRPISRAPDQWGIADSEGGSDKSLPWRKDKGGTVVAYIFALIFVLLVGSMPFALHFGRRVRPPMLTKMTIVEIIALYIWLIGGLYLFTNVLLFQSPHFSGVRSLSIEESVYLFSQILTTVGYGDITPAKVRGQVFVGIFVFIAIILIANMISEMMGIFEDWMENVLGTSLDMYPDAEPTPEAAPTAGGTPRAQTAARLLQIDHDAEEAKVHAAFMPVKASVLVFLGFVVVGTAFFHLYPGENKSIGQGIYMSFITLSSVGFGAFTPTTHTGMVFAAFWMLFGVGALGAVITSYSAFSKSMKHYEILMAKGEDNDQGSSHRISSVKIDTRKHRQSQREPATG